MFAWLKLSIVIAPDYCEINQQKECVLLPRVLKYFFMMKLALFLTCS